jgi:hypothetical protein
MVGVDWFLPAPILLGISEVLSAAKIIGWHYYRDNLSSPVPEENL